MMQGKRDLDIKNNIEIKIELKNTGINNPTSPWTIQNKKLEKIGNLILKRNLYELRKIIKWNFTNQNFGIINKKH